MRMRKITPVILALSMMGIFFLSTGMSWFKMLRPASYVGVCYNHVWSAETKITQEIADSFSIQMSRLTIHWGEVDRYTDEQMDSALDIAMPNDVPIWLTVREWHPEYMRLNVPDTQGVDFYMKGKFQGPVLPEHRDKWIDFCARVARVLGDRVKVYQIGNEPNLKRLVYRDSIIHQWLGEPEEWAENIMLVIGAIKALDDDCLIFPGGSGGLGSRDEWYMRGINYMLDNGADIDGLDMHYYGDLPSDMDEWDNYLIRVNEWCRERGLRYSFSETGFPSNRAWSKYISWNHYDSLRMIECLSHDSIETLFLDTLRALDPDNLLLPENMQIRIDSSAVCFGIFARHALSRGCYFVEKFGFISERPGWWHHSGCISPDELWRDRHLWSWQMQTSAGSYFGHKEASGEIVFYPIADTLRSIARSRLTNPR